MQKVYTVKIELDNAADFILNKRFATREEALAAERRFNEEYSIHNSYGQNFGDDFQACELKIGVTEDIFDDNSDLPEHER